MNLQNYGKMKNKTTNVNVSFCLYCVLLIEHHNENSLMQQPNERFSGKTKSAKSGVYLIPSLIEKHSESEIFEYYQSDLLSECSFSQGIQLWKQNWANKKNIPTTLWETLKYMNNMKEIFPNIIRILSILLTTAATSASVERANSALRHVKIDFRSMMGEERLNALLLVHIHRDIFLEYNKLIDMYASKYPRRMFLVNVFS